MNKLYNQKTEYFDKVLAVNENFDIIKKKIKLNNVDATLYLIDGFAKDDLMEYILEYLMKIKECEIKKIKCASELVEKFIPYIETSYSLDLEDGIKQILSGAILLVVDQIEEYIVIDARSYPVRGIHEPDNEKVLRGARDGFCETIIFNTALIRRRIRSCDLRIKIKTVGKVSKSDVVLVYLNDVVDQVFLAELSYKIDNLKCTALGFGNETLLEQLYKQTWYNPFPKIKYTERPDCACANLIEGKILILVDNFPQAMILPTSFVDFIQETDDYYFPMLTASYLRAIRISFMILGLITTPIWLLLISNPEVIPNNLKFIMPKDPINIAPFIQLLIIEFAIDGIKLAALNTPSVIGSSLSVVAGLILGDFAIKAGWFNTEIIFYMAFVSIASFSQPNLELGYAFKFLRIMLLALVFTLELPGLIIGFMIITYLLYNNKTLSNKPYFYPIIPFNFKAFINLFIRKKAN